MESPKLGIIMLDTSFQRPLGDIGNPATYSFPVEYRVVESATVERVVKKGDSSLVPLIIKSARELEKKGVKAIKTSCGFLALFQNEIQHALNVPFFSSSLIQLPIVHSLAGGSIGVLTASKASLSRKHLQGVNAENIPIIIEGMDTMPAFTQAIVEECMSLDMKAVEREIKHKVKNMIRSNPEIKAILLECTNMPPYRTAIREITELPIFDINTLIHYILKAT
ncbi:aspartate/glutamate racemase family protein [Oceanobacillus halophilus]|uniref:Aspartate/glutamate racemase family protein n=1 Tax=Oceanobacillus halophilus TaxID=930130 RepID=A0A495AB69_9BACI|nr:aspartate/glutamate racemase family protein [Oceanobacillus halophilus]RKQ37268.1 aspartate/glutamate racemase family protein [Oceanobacillus halophilus]